MHVARQHKNTRTLIHTLSHTHTNTHTHTLTHSHTHTHTHIHTHTMYQEDRHGGQAAHGNSSIVEDMNVHAVWLHTLQVCVKNILIDIKKYFNRRVFS